MRNDRPVRAIRKTTRRLRGLAYAVGIRLAGGTCGRGLEVESGATLRYGPHAGLRFGSNVYLGRGVVVDVPASADLALGDNVKVMHYTVIAASERISIGSGTQIAESCSIRDADHGSGTAEVSMADHLVTTPTEIGRDVWIARGVAVLRGSQIGDRAVVGANSVVTRQRPVPTDARAVGAPVVLLGPRAR